MYKKVNYLIIHTEPDVCLTQMSAKKEIKKHGIQEIQSVLKEFTQFDGNEIVLPLEPINLYPKEQRETL